MKIDLHVHSSEFSACAVSTMHEQIEAAIRRGLDAIAFTDHNRLMSFEQSKWLSDSYDPFKVFAGIELHIPRIGEDFIVLGLNETELMGKKWEYEDLIAFTREKDGFIFFCHPYRYNPTVHKSIIKFPPDAIETKSMNIGCAESKKAVSLAKQLGILALTNSDAHYMGHVGEYYNVLRTPVASNEELIKILRTGIAPALYS